MGKKENDKLLHSKWGSKLLKELLEGSHEIYNPYPVTILFLKRNVFFLFKEPDIIPPHTNRTLHHKQIAYIGFKCRASTGVN